MSFKEIHAYDYVSFRGLYESCERDHAAIQLERLQIDLAIAAAGAGGEGAFEDLEDRIDIYRMLLGFSEPAGQENGMAELMRDFGRGI